MSLKNNKYETKNPRICSVQKQNCSSYLSHHKAGNPKLWKGQIQNGAIKSLVKMSELFKAMLPRLFQTKGPLRILWAHLSNSLS